MTTQKYFLRKNALPSIRRTAERTDGIYPDLHDNAGMNLDGYQYLKFAI